MAPIKGRDSQKNPVEECYEWGCLDQLRERGELAEAIPAGRRYKGEVRGKQDALIERWLFRIALIQAALGQGAYALLLFVSIRWEVDFWTEPYILIFLLPSALLTATAVLVRKQKALVSALSQKNPQALNNLTYRVLPPLFLNMLSMGYFYFVFLLIVTLYTANKPYYAQEHYISDSHTLVALYGALAFMMFIYLIWIFLWIFDDNFHRLIESFSQKTGLPRVFTYRDLLASALAASFVLVPFYMSFLGGGLGWFISGITRCASFLILIALGGLVLACVAGYDKCSHERPPGVPLSFRKGDRVSPIFTVASFAVIGLLLGYPLWVATTPTYEKDVERVYTNEDERHAIEVAESLNYSEYFNLTPFYLHGGGASQPPSYFGYVWINFINRTTIDFYSKKIDVLRRERVKTNAHFQYRAEARGFSQALFRYFNGSIHVEVAGEDVETLPIYAAYISVGNFTYPDENHSDTKMRERWAPVQVNLSLERAFLVKMYISYREHYAPLAAFGNSFSQIVILDGEFNPRGIFIQWAPHWIS